MRIPTHIQVLVESARNLKIKGNGETNDALVTIQLSNDKFMTSIKEKAPKSVEWMEDCEFLIPKSDSKAELTIKVKHNGKLDTHQFLGMVSLPLKDLITEIDSDPTRSVSKWYALKCKPNQNKNDCRGDLKLTISLLEKSLNDTPHNSVSFTSVNENDNHINSNERWKKCKKVIKKSLTSLGNNGKTFGKNKDEGIYKYRYMYI